MPFSEYGKLYRNVAAPAAANASAIACIVACRIFVPAPCPSTIKRVVPSGRIKIADTSPLSGVATNFNSFAPFAINGHIDSRAFLRSGRIRSRDLLSSMVMSAQLVRSVPTDDQWIASIPPFANRVTQSGDKFISITIFMRPKALRFPQHAMLRRTMPRECRPAPNMDTPPEFQSSTDRPQQVRQSCQP
ncbi:MAG: hypothetical protein UZ17_ACD001001683 [Acidobacteria bacterium OLB17]|nr:MAG: hypothetical protein UZ17_ACD001001683 [Acidobacteria bacterium OLB17]